MSVSSWVRYLPIPSHFPFIPFIPCVISFARHPYNKHIMAHFWLRLNAPCPYLLSCLSIHSRILLYPCLSHFCFPFLNLPHSQVYNVRYTLPFVSLLPLNTTRSLIITSPVSHYSFLVYNSRMFVCSGSRILCIMRYLLQNTGFLYSWSFQAGLNVMLCRHTAISWIQYYILYKIRHGVYIGSWTDMQASQKDFKKFYWCVVINHDYEFFLICIHQFVEISEKS